MTKWDVYLVFADDLTQEIPIEGNPLECDTIWTVLHRLSNSDSISDNLVGVRIERSKKQ